MAIKKLLTGSAIYLAGSLLAAGLPFLLLPILTDYLVPAEFGRVGIFQGLYTFFLATCGLSVAGAVVRQTYEVAEAEIAAYIFNALLILAATTAVYALVIYAGLDWFSSILKVPREFFFPALLAASMVFIFNLLLGQFQVKEKPLAYTAFQVGSSALNIGLSMLGVIVLSAGAMGRVGGIVVAAVIFGSMSLFVLHRIGRLRFEYKPADMHSALRFGVPLMPHELGTFLLNWLSLFVLNSMIGTSQTGLYLLAFQISMALGVMCDAFNRAYVPWLFSVLSGTSHQDRATVVKLSYLYFLGLVIVVGLTFLIAPWLVSLIFNQLYAGAAWMVGWLVLGQALGGAYLIFTNYIMFTRKTEILSGITLLSNGVNIVLLFTLVPAIGLSGAVVGFVAARALILLITCFVATSLVPMPWRQDFFTGRNDH